MYIIKKRLQDAAIAHRLRNDYVGACANIHGHTYHFEVELHVENLDKYDMAVDFKDVKIICDDWIQSNWDHGVIVSLSDEVFHKFLVEEHMKHFVLSGNSTAENMAALLGNNFGRKFERHYPGKIYGLVIRIWETDTSVAECYFEMEDFRK